MTTHQEIRELLKADQKDRAFLKFKKYDSKLLTSLRIRDYERAEKICEIIGRKSILSKKDLFEAAVILHHSYYNLRFVVLGEKLAIKSYKSGFIRAGKLLDILRKDKNIIKRSLISKTLLNFE